MSILGQLKTHLDMYFHEFLIILFIVPYHFFGKLRSALGGENASMVIMTHVKTSKHLSRKVNQFDNFNFG
jgi:hypothetical protein